ncbi:speckle-type POZ protein-like [Oppia nitens]|uniref:speckle-type POZ protein-like n=1 Tax=Oppia nitens TaxID=1686743 RepID=UPI0023DA8759|nr:speckle-type POZ protein-like [Oppia nitens]
MSTLCETRVEKSRIDMILVVKAVNNVFNGLHVEYLSKSWAQFDVSIEIGSYEDNHYLSVHFNLIPIRYAVKKLFKKFITLSVAMIDKSGNVVHKMNWPEISVGLSRQRFGWNRYLDINRLFDSQIALVDNNCIRLQVSMQVNDEKQSKVFKNESINQLINSFKSLLIDNQLTDFTIIVEDKEFAVHKAILAARSPVLRALITTDMKEKSESKLVVHDIDKEVFQQFLLYVYTGSAPVDEHMCLKLSHLADFYDMPDLKCVCAQTVFRKLTEDNVFDALRFGQTYQMKELEINAIDFIAQNSDKIKAKIMEDIEQ